MRILTGDRPTGALHLGHYIGSLQNRVSLQEIYEQYIMIADLQSLTDNFNKTSILEENIYKVLASYLAVGIDPIRSTIFLQSAIPELAELTMYFMNLVTVNRVSRNPTVKDEIKLRNFEESIPLGFLNYPISQAADILLIGGQGIPVGNDQIPMIEQTNEIVRSFNNIYGVNFFKECVGLFSSCHRLIGICGKHKMSKSLGNAIFLADDEKLLWEKICKMYTDPNHIKITDPGTVEGNIVFAYLDIFDSRKEEIESLKEHYRKGGLGDMVLKKRLFDVLNQLLLPIREKYNMYYANKIFLKNILFEGTNRAAEIAVKNMKEIKKIMKIDFFS